MTEAAFWAECPDSEQDPEKLGGRPTVGPYRLAAQTVAECAQDGLTAEEIVEEFPGTPLEKVKAVLSYFYANQPEPTPSR